MYVSMDLCACVCVCVSVWCIYLVRNWYFCRFFGFSIVIYRTDDCDDYDSTNDEGRIIFSDILRVCFRSIISTAFVNHRRYCYSMAPLLTLSLYLLLNVSYNNNNNRAHTNLYFRIDFRAFAWRFFVLLLLLCFTALLRFGSVSFFLYLLFCNFEVYGLSHAILLNFSRFTARVYVLECSFCDEYLTDNCSVNFYKACSSVRLSVRLCVRSTIFCA